MEAAREDAARQLLRDAELARKAQAEAHYAAGYHYILLKKWDAATAELEEALRLAPSNLLVRQRLAFCYESTDRAEKAREILDKLAQESPDDYRLSLMLAERAIKEGDDDKALECLVKARDTAGADASGQEKLWVLRKLLDIHKRKGDKDGIIDDLSRMVELLPDYETLQERVTLADMLAAGGRAPEAAPHYEAAARILSNTRYIEPIIRIRLKLFDIYRADKKPEKAAESLDKLAAEVQANAHSSEPLPDNKLLEIGEELYARQAFAQALGVYLLTTDRQPPALFRCGLCNVSLGRLAEAVPFFARYSEIQPEDWRPNKILEDVHTALKQPEDALKQRTLALGKLMKQAETGRLDGNPEALLLLLSLASRDAEKGGGAAQLVEKRLAAVKMPEAQIQIRYALGEACYRADDGEGVEKHFREILKIKPDLALANNYLGYFYAEKGRNLDEAESLVRKALQAEPENPAYLDSLAWVFYRQGLEKGENDRVARALELLNAACGKIEDSVIFDHRGDVHMKLGNSAQAVSDWRKALEIRKGQETPLPGFSEEAILDKIRKAVPEGGNGQ